MLPLINLMRVSWPNRQKFLEKHGERMVHIHSSHGIWRPNGVGYTDAFAEAGRWTLYEAYRQTSHCGPEKNVRFYFIYSKKPLLYIPVEIEIVTPHARYYIDPTSHNNAMTAIEKMQFAIEQIRQAPEKLLYFSMQCIMENPDRPEEKAYYQSIKP